MSNRKTLTDTLRRLNAGTLPELAEATGWPERKVRDTIGDLKTAGLVSSERDDVTGKPLYRLTKAGATWTPTEDDAIRAAYQMESAREIAERIGRSEKAVFQRAHELGLRKTRDWIAERARQIMRDPNHGGRRAQFKPGQDAWNKGKHYQPGGRCIETQFKPGRPPELARNYLAIGSERISKDGYLERKISDDQRVAPAQRWRAVHILLWEAANGPLPKSHAVVFKDGDKRHIAIDNLELVTRAELMRRNSVHRHGPEVAQLSRLRGVLVRAINRRSRGQPQETGENP
jgi:hypothetical protein